jgi:hypothetical protein
MSFLSPPGLGVLESSTAFLVGLVGGDVEWVIWGPRCQLAMEPIAPKISRPTFFLMRRRSGKRQRTAALHDARAFIHALVFPWKVSGTETRYVGE